MGAETIEQSYQSPGPLNDSAIGRGPFPYDENIVFLESSFFKTHHSLPSPAEVRAVASLSTDVRAKIRTRPTPVRFPSVGLIVKYGTEITLAEGQCLLYIRKTLGRVVPVPEVYGWCQDGGQTFLYMELIDGITLEERWESLGEAERISVCEQLRYMVDAWRGLKQDFAPPFIGHVGRQPLLDVIFTNSCSPNAGPFSSVSDFTDWFTLAIGPGRTRRDFRGQSPHPYRSFVPDHGPILFTHADLHPSNIILSAGPHPQIVAIIDWHQSGWYPEYWEYCKARWTSWIGQEWEAKYLPLFVDRYDCYDYWDYFVLARGV